MNFRVTLDSEILASFPYEYQAIQFARLCLGNNQAVQVWYESLVDGGAKRVMEII